MAYKRLAALLLTLCAVIACKHEMTSEEARERLGAMSVTYSEASFTDCAANGDAIAVSLFLKAGMNVDARDSQGRIAYQFADVKDYKIIGAENVYQYMGKKTESTTALMVAAIKGRAEIVKILIENHADVNLKDRVEYTALMYAKLAKADAVVDLLKQSGAGE